MPRQVFATGRYEIAILLPAEDDRARDLVYTVFAITGAIAIVTLLVVLAFAGVIADAVSSAS